MPMYNLIEYNENYSKTSRSLWQYYRYEASANITDSESFIFTVKTTGITTDGDNTKYVEVA